MKQIEELVSDGLEQITEFICLNKIGKDHEYFGGLLGGQYGYGVNFENEVFMIHRYCWCDQEDCLWCGGSECSGDIPKMPHAATCYQTELHQRMEEYDTQSGYREIDKATFGGERDLLDGFDMEQEEVEPGIVMISAEPRQDEAMEKWRTAYRSRQKFEKRLFAELCRKHGRSPKSGAAVHCTCGADQDWQFRYDTCKCDWHLGRGIYQYGPATSAPNFWHKSSRSRVNWYKYIGRGMEIDLNEEWSKILNECLGSLKV